MLAIVGLISVIGVSVMIALFWANPVIKSFGREHLVLIMIGLTLSFFSPLVYVFRPSVGLCVIRRVSFQFSWTMVLASILVKLIRVTRIFLGGIRSTRKYFLKPWHQVVFTFLIVGGKMVLGVIWIMVDLPDLVSTEMDNNTDDGFPILITTCASIHTAMLVLLLLYDTVLVILINGLGVFTIRFPANFKEARNIAFATFAVGVIWLAFILLYFGTKNVSLSGSVAITKVCMAFSILVCLILPRLYTAFINRNSSSPSTPKSANLEKTLKTLTVDGLPK